MARFGGKALFDSGPSEVRVGGLSIRHVLQQTPGGRGVRLTHLGHHGRSIVQEGVLVADDREGVRALGAGIEAMLDGVAYELVDGGGVSWAGVVMLSFEPEAVGRVGARWRMGYRVQYLQVAP